VSLAHNEEDGRVFCHVCDWQAGPYASFEMIEAAISQHLRESHGLTLRYAVEEPSGKVRTTPLDTDRRPLVSDLDDALMLLSRLCRAVLKEQGKEIAHKAMAWLHKIGYDKTRSPLRDGEDGGQ
jgi:hypothetical protein